MNHNNLIIEKSWWNTNWKWFLPTIIVTLLLAFGVILNSSKEGNITDIAKAYSDTLLYEKAIEKSNRNQRVLATIGIIEPIDKLAILEGNTIYSNNYNSVETSVRIKGNKGSGKIDIYADKIRTGWKYKMIKIRNKEAKEEIEILMDTIQN